MALVYQHNINETTRLAVWHITEPPSFFLQRVPLKKDVSHPHKRLQHLAGRYLLAFLFDDFPLQEILVADTRKPFLENEAYHFSISHCGDYAAAIVSTQERVGIDIELVTDRIKRVQHKFTNADELVFLNDEYRAFLQQFDLEEKIEQEFLTMIWSAKETIFKWYGDGQMDFREHMQLTGSIGFGADDLISLPFLFTKEEMRYFTVRAKLFSGFVLAWVNTARSS
ncbi:MAG TPA: 4'-phosphopantetheinyl transferase superfamily protein [Chitinophagaceae bacterium]|nr:4'-phosphopantetheinyl transferase superfamily protein [Chitinophagaceae bacterium]